MELEGKMTWLTLVCWTPRLFSLSFFPFEWRIQFLCNDHFFLSQWISSACMEDRIWQMYLMFMVVLWSVPLSMCECSSISIFFSVPQLTYRTSFVVLFWNRPPWYYVRVQTYERLWPPLHHETTTITAVMTEIAGRQAGRRNEQIIW